MLSNSLVLALGLLSAELVAGHATVVAVKGDANSATGMGLGVTPGVNRNSQIPKIPSNQPSNPEADTTVFGHGNAAATGCGKTALNGPLQDSGAISNAVQTMMAATGGTLPAVNQGGTLTVTMHQVNADGAPTYKADIDTTGTGTGTFQQMTVTSGGQGAGGILGDQGLSFNIGSLPANNTVTMQMPNTACTGTVGNQNNVCMVRLMNNAAAGGFGSCMAVTMGGSSSGSSSTRRHARDVVARELPITWIE